MTWVDEPSMGRDLKSTVEVQYRPYYSAPSGWIGSNPRLSTIANAEGEVENVPGPLGL